MRWKELLRRVVLAFWNIVSKFLSILYLRLPSLSTVAAWRFFFFLERTPGACWSCIGSRHFSDRADRNAVPARSLALERPLKDHDATGTKIFPHGCSEIVNGGYSQNGAGRGLRGTFVHGCMLDVWLVACVREKLTLGELLFAPFPWKRVGWYLQTISVFEKLEKSSTERVKARWFYFLRIDDGEQCGTQNNVQ